MESRAKEKEIDDGAASAGGKNLSFFSSFPPATLSQKSALSLFLDPPPPLCPCTYPPTGEGGPSPPRVEREKEKSAQHSSLFSNPFP